MSDDPFQILVNLLYANKQTKSYTLVLGPGLSFTPALWQKVGKPCASWGEFYDIIETMKREDYTALLKDHFATLQLQDGYQALAQLILEGYFKVVFTMNIDTFLEEAIEHAIKALPDGSKAVKRLFRGKNASDKYDFEHLFDKQISTDLEHLSAEQNAICWLRGHMGGQYYGTLSEIIYFLESAKAELRPWSLESVVKGYLSKNVLLVGFIRDADLDISRCLSKIGGAIWYVSPDPEPTDLSSDRCNGKVISGTEADFNTFFRSLAEALQRKDLMSSKSEPQRDFFISYNSQDRQRAEWIAWQLEQEGYSVYIQAWDFLPGSNFVLEMQLAASRSKRTIAVLSENYLDARFTQSEWAAALVQDPTGERRILLPVRIRECNPEGILKAIVYIDLVGLDEAVASKRLLDDVRAVVQQRNKPDTPPAFSC